MLSLLARKKGVREDFWGTKKGERREGEKFLLFLYCHFFFFNENVFKRILVE